MGLWCSGNIPRSKRDDRGSIPWRPAKIMPTYLSGEGAALSMQFRRVRSSSWAPRLYRANFDGEVPALNRRELSSNLRRGTKQYPVTQLVWRNGFQPFETGAKPVQGTNQCRCRIAGAYASLKRMRRRFDSVRRHMPIFAINNFI